MSSSRGRGRGKFAGLFRSRATSTPGGSTSTPVDASPQTSTGSGGMSGHVRDLSLGSTDDVPVTPGDISSTTVETRVRVSLAPDGSLEPAAKVAHAVGKIIRGMHDEEGYAWRFVPERMKELYFIEFQKSFYWDESINDRVEAKFYAKAAERYKDWVCKAKAKRHSKGKPEEISAHVWEKWCAYWDLDSTKEISRVAKKNRLADVDGPGSGPSRHRAGARSAATIAAALVDVLQKKAESACSEAEGLRARLHTLEEESALNKENLDEILRRMDSH